MPTTDTQLDLKTEILPYPLATTTQCELIGLLRTEWTRTDYDWLEAMNGDYSENLVITSVLGRRDGELVATATIHFARHQPEIAVIGGVLTRRDYRDQGLAGQLLEVMLELAKTAGCRVCLLGTARNPHNVYMHHGFAWQHGTVMSRNFGAVDFEERYFVAGQSAAIRAAHWGDLPGVTMLAAQEITTVCLDYPRGLFSGRYIAADRCLSNFPVLWYDTAARGGLLAVLAEPTSGRVFGFGSVTRNPGSARRHTATIEFAVHDHYEAQQPALLEHLLADCRTREIHCIDAVVAVGDVSKLACLRAAGFTEVTRLPGVLRLSSGPSDVILLQRTV